MKRNEGHIERGIAGCKDGRISRHLVNTKIISPCPNCSCITFDLMEEDGRVKFDLPEMFKNLGRDLNHAIDKELHGKD